MTELIEKQITHCKTLLKVFQDERRVYSEKNAVDMSDVLASMKQKQRMVEVLAGQQSLAQKPPQDETERKRLRELAQLLEQLLVIEQENEIMLSRLMRQGGGAESRASARPVLQNRPALQQRLPFVPPQAVSTATAQRAFTPNQVSASSRPLAKYI